MVVYVSTIASSRHGPRLKVSPQYGDRLYGNVPWIWCIFVLTPIPSLYAILKVLVPLNPILNFADYIHHHHRDPCLFSAALEPGWKRQATP